MNWTVEKVLAWAVGYFAEKGIGSARLDAELLLGHALGLSRIQLYMHFDQPLSESELQAFKVLVKRRAAREPVPYILREKEFYSLKFFVSPQVLIPRPETEGLVEQGLAFIREAEIEEPRILDLATGSGCILISLLKHLPKAQGLGVDLSDSALETARRNGELHGVAERVQWLRHDLRGSLEALATEGPFHLLTANLPYVSEEEFSRLEPEIRNHEPREALVAGPQGTELFAAVLPQIHALLAEGGMALLETGSDQGEALTILAGKLCPDLAFQLKNDLSGLPRYLRLQRPDSSA